MMGFLQDIKDKIKWYYRTEEVQEIVLENDFDFYSHPRIKQLRKGVYKVGRDEFYVMRMQKANQLRLQSVPNPSCPSIFFDLKEYKAGDILRLTFKFPVFQGSIGVKIKRGQSYWVKRIMSDFDCVLTSDVDVPLERNFLDGYVF